MITVVETMYYREYLVQLACWQIGKWLTSSNLDRVRAMQGRKQLQLTGDHEALDQRWFHSNERLNHLGLAEYPVLEDVLRPDPALLGADHHRLAAAESSSARQAAGRHRARQHHPTVG